MIPRAPFSTCCKMGPKEVIDCGPKIAPKAGIAFFTLVKDIFGRHPVITTGSTPFDSSSSLWIILSSVGSLTPQVFRIITSALSIISDRSKPSKLRRPTIRSESARFREHPKVSRKYFKEYTIPLVHEVEWLLHRPHEQMYFHLTEYPHQSYLA